MWECRVAQGGGRCQGGSNFCPWGITACQHCMMHGTCRRVPYRCWPRAARGWASTRTGCRTLTSSAQLKPNARTWQGISSSCAFMCHGRPDAFFWGGAEDLQRRGRGIRPAQGQPQLGRILGGYGDVAVRNQHDVQGNSLSAVGAILLLQGKMKDNGLIDFTYEAPVDGSLLAGLSDLDGTTSPCKN